MRNRERKKYRIIILVVAVVSFILGRCSGGCSEPSEAVEESIDTIAQEEDKRADAVVVAEEEVAEEEVAEEEDADEERPLDVEAAIEILNRCPDARWNTSLEVDDSEVAQPLETNFRGRRSEVFNDSNHVQLIAAEKMGIRPITDMASAWNLSRGVELIASCEEYFLDELTHSYPFLVPEASQLLKEIGGRFNELLWERGQSKYRIKVTSVLRTPETIKDLMRRNKNAIEVSTHQYATTFDISYSKFVKDSAENPRTFGNLTDLLSEVLQEFQSQGRCYVKYEAKQSCFHVTVRPSK